MQLVKGLTKEAQPGIDVDKLRARGSREAVQHHLRQILGVVVLVLGLFRPRDGALEADRNTQRFVHRKTLPRTSHRSCARRRPSLLDPSSAHSGIVPGDVGRIKEREDARQLRIEDLDHGQAAHGGAQAYRILLASLPSTASNCSSSTFTD